MADHDLIVALGPRRYRVERPFGSWPANAGKVTDVAVDARGHVFVLLRHDPLTDAAEPRVIELSPQGVYLGGWGGEAIADSHLMAFDRAGRLMVVDRDMHEVIFFSGDGRRVGGLGRRREPLNPFNHPSDVAEAPNGEFFVADGYAASHVHRFAADGRHLATWGSLGREPDALGEPHSVWVRPDGIIAIVDRTHDRLKLFTAAGALTQVVEGFFRPMSVWGDEAGNLFVTDQVPSLHMIGADGSRIGRCRPVLNGAHGLSGAQNGDIFLAEGNPSRITRLAVLGNASEHP